jgi:hypothetical protein
MFKIKIKTIRRGDRPRSPGTPDGGTTFGIIENQRATEDGRPYGTVLTLTLTLKY